MSSKSYPAVAARGLAVCQSPFCRSGLIRACTEPGILGALGNISHVFKLNGGVSSLQQQDTQGIPNSHSGHWMPISMVHQEQDFLLCKLLHTHVAMVHPAQLRDPPPMATPGSHLAVCMHPDAHHHQSICPGTRGRGWQATTKPCTYYLRLCLSHAPPSVPFCLHRKKFGKCNKDKVKLYIK